ncbi:MAG: FAD-binding oxidoreductase [Deltaproteobacteria bacterium]|nr:FAD-binding oxidoreductase [Deltaproteobacteria bacterium]
MPDQKTNHDAKVKTIAQQIRKALAKRRPIHIHKGGVSHFVPLPGDSRFRGEPIDISSLNNILEIDLQQRICRAEPGISFSELVKETLKVGLAPTVVPELEGITLGGAVAGCSVESMSYKYGGFHDSALEYEVITGDGEIVTCSPSKDPLLFNMIHGSYGTLGILTQLTFRLIPAKPFVKLAYKRFDHFEPFERALFQACQSGAPFDFIDAIAHTPQDFVLCLGEFADSAPYTNNYRWLNIFYKSTLARKEDYLTTYDYFFRYDTECHWLTRTIPFMEKRIPRLLFGKCLLGSTRLIQWSMRLKWLLELKKRPDVVCDVFIPSKRFREFFLWYREEFDFYPLWVIPYRIPRIYPWVSDPHAARMKDDLFIDCAIYGKPNSDARIDYSILLEKKTLEFDGIKTLISRNHFTRQEFWTIYHQENYQKAKKRLDPKGLFPDLYEKFHPSQTPCSTKFFRENSASH